MSMTRRSRRALAAIGVAASLLLAGTASARADDAMTMTEQTPKPSEIMDGSAVFFSLRFDRAIDHRLSRFVLVTPKGERRIRASLDAEPNTLYASVGRLAPGTYELRWRARAADGHLLSGTTPLQIR